MAEAKKRTMMKSLPLAVALWMTWLALGQGAERSEIFKIQIVDEQTSRGVPLVELKTVHHQQFVTDSAGVVAIRDALLLDHFPYRSREGAALFTRHSGRPSRSRYGFSRKRNGHVGS